MYLHSAGPYNSGLIFCLGEKWINKNRRFYPLRHKNIGSQNIELFGVDFGLLCIFLTRIVAILLSCHENRISARSKGLCGS